MAVLAGIIDKLINEDENVIVLIIMTSLLLEIFIEKCNTTFYFIIIYYEITNAKSKI